MEVNRGLNVGLVGVIRMSLVQILRELWFAEEMTGILYRVVIQKPYFTKKDCISAIDPLYVVNGR